MSRASKNHIFWVQGIGRGLGHIWQCLMWCWEFQQGKPRTFSTESSRFPHRPLPVALLSTTPFCLVLILLLYPSSHTLFGWQIFPLVSKAMLKAQKTSVNREVNSVRFQLPLQNPGVRRLLRHAQVWENKRDNTLFSLSHLLSESSFFHREYGTLKTAQGSVQEVPEPQQIFKWQIFELNSSSTVIR